MNNIDTPSTNYFASQCKICLKEGHGQHFGIETCRACAAFFRRAVVLNRKYKCLKRSGKCEIGEEKVLCKFCRFKKCISLGMTTENVRTDQVIRCDQEESPEVSSQLVPAGEPGSSSSDAPPVEYCIIHPRTRKPAMLIDVNAIIKRSKAVLETYFLEDEDSILHLNPLQRMVHSLRKLRIKQKWNPEFFVNIKFYDLFGMWEKQMVDAAQWLIVFGGKMIQYYDIIVQPYLEMNLDTTEVTFILCQIVWNYAGRRLQGQTQSAGERFLAVISDNLHEYYEKDRTTSEKERNYAGRLAKMMRMVNQILNIQLKREETMDMAMLFDMFNIVITEPEFFRV